MNLRRFLEEFMLSVRRSREKGLENSGRHHMMQVKNDVQGEIERSKIKSCILSRIGEEYKWKTLNP